MFNDLRARRFRYNACDLETTLDELAAAAAGFCEEIARTGEHDWSRVATRLPGEHRTARWLAESAKHSAELRPTADPLTEFGSEQVVL
jgi:hypothetical protein